MDMRVLIRLCGGFGTGDTVQFIVVLKHLRRYRPHWIIDCQAQRGAHVALVEWCAGCLHHDEPVDLTQYERAVDLELHEQYIAFDDRPSTKMARCLWVNFDLREFHRDYLPEINVRQPARKRATAWLRARAGDDSDGRFRAVALHYQGQSSKHKKDLEHWQAREICAAILRAGRTPIVLDLAGDSPLVDGTTIFSPRVGGQDIWGGYGGGDAEVMAALIQQCEAYIGVDSGPGKIASTTSTPTLIAWTRHHPAQFHDPHDGTLHLVPDGWESSPPLGDHRVAQYFRDHYRFDAYRGPHDLVGRITGWLALALGVPNLGIPIEFVVPARRQSAIWAMAKMSALAGGRRCNVTLAGMRDSYEAQQVFEYVSRQDGVAAVRIMNLPIVHRAEPDSRGRHDYLSDGEHDGRHYLIPDRVIEAGGSIDDWLPDVKANWSMVL